MTTFVNNWKRSIALAQGATEASLDLPDGSYRLTLADSEGTRWEIVDALVDDGTATLTRGQEGTDDQLWPAGSVIFCSLTAAQIEQFGSGGSGLMPIVSVEDGDQQTLPAAPAWVVASLFGGQVTTLDLPEVDLAGAQGARLTWDMQLVLDDPSSLVLQVPASYTLLFADFAGSGLQIAASYNDQTGALTITPTGASAFHRMEIEATYYEPGPGALVLDLLLRVLPTESTTPIYDPFG